MHRLKANRRLGPAVTGGLNPMRYGLYATVRLAVLIPVAAVLLANAAATEAQAQTRRAKGFVREPDAVYRGFDMTPRYRSFLPPAADLSPAFPTPGDQGQQSSCTAWAVGYALRSYYEGKRQQWNFSAANQLISPAYIYNHLHNYSGDCSQGTPISYALDLLKTQGAPTLEAFPYVENDCTVKPNPAVMGAASQFRIRSWKALDPKKIDDAKGQIHRGNPVVFGMDISDEFEKWSGDAVYDNTSSPRTGGHAMVIVGYSEPRQAFKIINSWGTSWGENGFGWISYRAMRELADRQFVVELPELPDPVLVKPHTLPKPVAVVVPKPVPIAVDPPKPAPVVVKPPAPPPPVAVVEPKPVPPPPVAIVEPKPVLIVVAPPRPVIAEPPPVAIVEPKPAPAPVAIDPPKPAPVVVTPPKPAPVVVAPAPVVKPPPPAPKPVVAVQPPPPEIPPVATVRSQVASQAQQLQCAKVESSVSSDRTARVRGFAGFAGEVDKLRADLAAMPGVNRVETDVRVYPWPQCEVYLNFAGALASQRGLNAAVRGGSTTLSAGDSLAVEVVTPAYPSYVYISYLQASGDVVNLAWPEGRSPKAMPPNTKLTFGGGTNGQPIYRIGAPFGDEIIVVITSASPLFQDEPAETVTEREYLTSFRRAFLVQRMFSAVALPLKTQPKP